MLMKRGQGSSHQAAGVAGRDGKEKREWTVKGETLAGWSLGREKGWPLVRETVGGEDGEEGSGDERDRGGEKGLGVYGKKGVRYVSLSHLT